MLFELKEFKKFNLWACQGVGLLQIKKKDFIFSLNIAIVKDFFWSELTEAQNASALPIFDHK